MMGNRDDPEVDATIKSYLRSLYNNPAKAPEKMEEPLELTSQVEHKYTAAQTVEYGIQVGAPVQPRQMPLPSSVPACLTNLCRPGRRTLPCR